MSEPPTKPAMAPVTPLENPNAHPPSKLEAYVGTTASPERRANAHTYKSIPSAPWSRSQGPIVLIFQKSTTDPSGGRIVPRAARIAAGPSPEMIRRQSGGGDGFWAVLS